jgi:hypothetical protein
VISHANMQKELIVQRAKKTSMIHSGVQKFEKGPTFLPFFKITHQIYNFASSKFF